MKVKTIFFILIYFLVFSSKAQTGSSDEVNLLFYNVENLFDVTDDPNTEDDDLTPKGYKHWTFKRLNNKLLNISKVILSSTGWQVPDIIALAEIENRWVIEQLLSNTPLKNIPYGVIHKESPDHRGLDVAFLYNKEQFYPLMYEYFPLLSKTNQVERTREILYVKGIIKGTDTLHVFVNHWPSRYSGLLETKSMRNVAASLLKSKIDELFMNSYSSKIVIVGDFNDNPKDESISGILKAGSINTGVDKQSLYNLSADWPNQGIGTLKYQSQWDVFDQIIVSGSLLETKSGFRTTVSNASIVQLPFLFEEDEKYGGSKPFRTYYGFQYIGGFSDHLPVRLKMETN